MVRATSVAVTTATATAAAVAAPAAAVGHGPDVGARAAAVWRNLSRRVQPPGQTGAQPHQRDEPYEDGEDRKGGHDLILPRARHGLRIVEAAVVWS